MHFEEHDDQLLTFIHWLDLLLGVAQIVNRADGMSFDEHDDQLFEVL